MTGGPARWLLIGNSRWHWAEASSAGWRCWHQEPPEPGAATAAVGVQPQAWAAVGSPAGAALAPQRRLQLLEVPLLGAPDWLGIDRALAGWGAWRHGRSSVLVADAGTVLSLTLVDRDGRFVGGRLQAGLALQLKAMARGTQALPPLGPEAVPGRNIWPQPTAEAMLQGVHLGLAAAIALAAAERRATDPGCRLVLTGGDAAVLAPLVARAQSRCGDSPAATQPPPELRPDLCLETLALLRPAPMRPAFSSDPDR